MTVSEPDSVTSPSFDAHGIVVVIPAYNESTVLEHVLDDVARWVPRSQILVVNDASTDQTVQVATSAGAVVINHLINRGQGAALGTGLQAALSFGAKVIVTFDADRQHGADDIPVMVQPIIAGEAEVVLGTRFGAGTAQDMPLLRRFLLRMATLFTRIFSGIRVTDTHNGFRALSAKAAATITMRQDRMAHASEILEQIKHHRLRFVERPVHIRYSEYSMAKGQRSRDALKIMFRILLRRVQD